MNYHISGLIDRLSTQFSDLLPIQIEFLKICKCDTKMAESAFRPPSAAEIELCKANLLKVLGEMISYSAAAPVTKYIGTLEDTIYIYSIFGAMIYEKCNRTFPFEAVLRIINLALQNEGKALVQNSKILKMVEWLRSNVDHVESSSVLARSKYVFDSFSEYRT